jgi:hypothetical protein
MEIVWGRFTACAPLEFRVHLRHGDLPIEHYITLVEGEDKSK